MTSVTRSFEDCSQLRTNSYSDVFLQTWKQAQNVSKFVDHLIRIIHRKHNKRFITYRENQVLGESEFILILGNRPFVRNEHRRSRHIQVGLEKPVSRRQELNAICRKISLKIKTYARIVLKAAKKKKEENKIT